MVFKTKEDVYHYLDALEYITLGSQGESYRDRTSVYKIFHGFEDESEEELFSKGQILQFKDVKNKTFIFPNELILLKERIIGYIAKYVQAKNLYETNPLRINLERLKKVIELALKDIELISRKGISCDDIMYNILLGKRLYIIDTIGYTLSDEDYTKLYKENVRLFNLEIMFFLVDGIFEEVIRGNKILKEMYHSRGNDISVIEFIDRLKDYLSELMGKEITTLKNARPLMDKKIENHEYQRSLVLEKTTS